MITDQRALTTGEIADYCGVSRSTVHLWIKEGKLPVTYSTPGGHYRITVADFRKFLETYNMPAPSLPQSEPFVPEPAEPEPPKRSSPGWQVLVVDDETLLVDIVTRALQGAGYRVESAHDGLSAMYKAGKLRPDLMILDILMPGLDGVEVCRQIKSDPDMKGAKVLFISAHPWLLNSEAARNSGADAFLEKPFHLGELLERVRSLLHED